MDNVNDYIRRYVPREKMRQAYDNCMYTLGLRSLDDGLEDELSNQQDAFSVCREIVGYYYCKLNQTGYFIDENNNESDRIDYRFYIIDEIIESWIPIFDEMANNRTQEFGDIYDTVASDYISLIRWPLSRLNNIRNTSNYEYFHKKIMYCNLLFRRTSEYLSYAIDKKSNIWSLINILIEKMEHCKLTEPNLEKLISEYSEKRCVAVAKVVNKYHTVDWKISFSGFWDNESICKRFGITGLESQFNKVYTNVIKRIQFKNIDVKEMIWCKLNYNVKSYEIRPTTSPPSELSDFKKDINRLKCYKKHFSCCERKILANIKGTSKISKIRIYVTYEPCNDCKKAISSYSAGLISVVFKNKYISKGHVCKDFIY
ncbi:hypothetical protein [Tissierella sp. Yu-01]|uniref:hypothetical protein n=1 Tax=Tissierella sp. Yu-01 TaxID=3035694 RepID=UPI00240D5D17|nr:hypothetical protein [Tissierella sp. Yu-01]WFA08911.1 hypothetical protein P3962_14475 [Tissierella sp. Yu-01]